MDKVFAAISVGLGAILLIVVSTVLSGWAMVNMWGWFVVPVFHLPPLTIMQAVGLGLVVSYWTHQTAKDEDGEVSRAIAVALVKPLIFVGIGYAVSRFL